MASLSSTVNRHVQFGKLSPPTERPGQDIETNLTGNRYRPGGSSYLDRAAFRDRSGCFEGNILPELRSAPRRRRSPVEEGAGDVVGGARFEEIGAGVLLVHMDSFRYNLDCSRGPGD